MKLSGNSVGREKIEYLFVRNKKEIIKFTDSINYRPSF